MDSIAPHSTHCDATVSASGECKESSSSPADKSPAAAGVAAGGSGSPSGSADAMDVGGEQQEEQQSERSTSPDATGPVPKRTRDGTHAGANSDESGSPPARDTNDDAPFEVSAHSRRCSRPHHKSGYRNSGGGGAAAAGVEGTANTGFGQQAAAANAPTAQETHTVAAVLMIAGQSHSISALISINRHDTAHLLAALGVLNGSTGALASGQPSAAQSFGSMRQQQFVPFYASQDVRSFGPNNQFRGGRGGRNRGNRGGRGNRGRGPRNFDEIGAPTGQPAQMMQPDAAAGENNPNGVISHFN